MSMEIQQEQVSSSWFSWCCVWRAFSSSYYREVKRSSSNLTEEAFDDNKRVIMAASSKKKPGGWKSMPYIIGNETCERLAAVGLLANFMVYLRREYHMEQVTATNLINVYTGVSNFAPLLGAFLSDAYIGRFWAIAIGSVTTFLGMVTLTLTSWVPNLKPAWCPYNDQKDAVSQSQLLSSCAKPTTAQFAFLVLSLSLLSVGTGCVRPNSIPFGVDQFDHTSEEGRRGINSYYNWYYTTFTIVIMFTLTVMVYIQDSVSWVWGFGIPTFLMFCSIVLFVFGMRFYVFIKPEGSVFSNIFLVFVAAYKKRHLALPCGVKEAGVFYEPPVTGVLDTKLHLTDQFSFLNKAALIQPGETNQNGEPTQASTWTLCSIQHIEEVKCLIRVLPIWASGIICFTAAGQTSTFTVLQAMIMNRHLGPKFEIPAGTIVIVSMIAVGIWVPIYDRLVVPALRRFTKHDEGLTLLQRLGIGIILSILAMVIAGLVEQRRRDAANIHNVTVSIMWLVPQLVVLGLAEGFNFIAQIEFYNKQFPENLRSLATSLFFCTIAGSSYFSTALVSFIHGFTGRNGRPDWLTNDLNQGRVDYFYYLLALLGVFNFIYFVICAKNYRYKEIAGLRGNDVDDVELSVVKE